MERQSDTQVNYGYFLGRMVNNAFNITRPQQCYLEFVVKKRTYAIQSEIKLCNALTAESITLMCIYR